MNYISNQNNINKIDFKDYFIYNVNEFYDMDFETCYNILNSLQSEELKKIFALDVFEKWINYYIVNYSDNQNNILFEQCKFFLNFISVDHLLIKKIINNDINRFIKILCLFDYNDIYNIKNKLIFNDINCLDFMVKRYGHYDKDTIKKSLIDMAVGYYFVNINVIKWIIDNYYNYILDDIEFILLEIIKINNYANIDNCYIIMEYLIKNIDMNNKTKLNIFKKSIYYNNKFLFDLFVNYVFDDLSSDNIFRLVCLNVDPYLPIIDTLVSYTLVTNNITNNIINNKFYNKLKIKGIYNVVNWFHTYFDNNFNPLIDIFFISNHISIIRKKHEKECFICYENKSKIISLSCHSTHNICEDCMKIWYKNNNTCPMCRTNINFSKSFEFINTSI